ncbi:hypothetical protein PHET_03968 [Paragonimus heterotremus]|uniref:Rho GTPase-activating protein 21 n=1 Tax=Paragonimus heterotremus TaxID=100268 RepID=A0A8J4WHI0_9TREM|nr:hypothetical protein PHET_03968 [Paragonimus heterotremus]
MEVSRHFKLRRASFGYGFSLKDEGKPFGPTAMVVKVEPGGAADRAGIRVGYQIEALGGRPVESMTYLQASNVIRASSDHLELSVIMASDIKEASSVPPTSLFEDFKKDYTSHSTLNATVQTCATKNSKSNSGSVRFATEPHSVTATRLSGALPFSTISENLPTKQDLSCLSAFSRDSTISSKPPPQQNTSQLSESVLHVIPVPKPRLSRQKPVQSPPASPTSSSSQSPFVSPSSQQLSSSNSINSTTNRFIIIQPALSTIPAALSSESPSKFDSAQAATQHSDVIHPGAPLSPTFPTPKQNDDYPSNADDPVQHYFIGARQKPPIRRMTVSRPNLEDEDETQRVCFVRKRAYASARHAGRFDEIHGLPLCPSPTAGSPKSIDGTGETSTSSCQLLPAAPQSNVHVVEPQITHLPRRRSTKSSRPLQMAIPASRDPVVSSPDCRWKHGQVTENLSVGPRCSSDNDVRNSDTAGTNAVERRPLHPSFDVEDLSVSNRAILPRLRITKQGDLWTSFHSDPNDCSQDLWTKAGEAYRSIEIADQQIARKLALQQTRQLSVESDSLRETSEAISNLEMGPNKENRLTRSNRNLHDHGTWSSPINRRDHRPHVSNGSYQTIDLVPSALKGSNPNWSQFRNLCTGGRYHRSETSVHRDLSGSFLSRQCLCKILSIGGSINKTYSWKPYYMSITGQEVRFIKASAAFCGSHRSSKNSKASVDLATVDNTGASNSIDLSSSLASTGGFPELHLSTKTCGTEANELSIGDTHHQPTATAHAIPHLSSSCLILPTTGLLWHPEEVPADFPQWLPLGPMSALSYGGVVAHPPIVPDNMNPYLSGISNLGKDPPSTLSVTQSATPDKKSTDRDSTVRASFRCYRFAHPDAKVELLLVFPDEGVAITCLRMCEVSGGKQITRQFQTNSDSFSFHSTDNPYELHLIGDHNNARIISKSRHSSHTVHSSAAGSNTHASASVDSSHVVLKQSNQIRLKDRRQRQFEHQPSSKDRVWIVQASDIPLQKQCTGADRTGNLNSTDGSDLVDSITTFTKCDQLSSPDRLTEDRTTSTSRPTAGKTPFLQSIKQLLNWPASGSSVDKDNCGLDQHAATRSPSPLSLESRLAAVFGDPPDFSELDNPGPVFGCALENQLESPDHPCVPVFLQAFVTAIEAHGMSLLGLYRKPGRQRSINQFVCAANLLPKDVDFLLTLDAWREPYALSGLVKHFLRRLPVRLLDLTVWEPLAFLVPDKGSSEDFSRSAYLLLSIRVKLWKMANEAFGISNGFLLPLEPSGLVGHSKEINPSTSQYSTNILSLLQSDAFSEPVGHNCPSAKWRWATLIYTIRHLRQVVACEQRNEITYQCAAICFGPVLFSDSVHVDKLNGVLENLLKHWPWLVEGLPTMEDARSISSPRLYKQTADSMLADAINYLKKLESPDLSLFSAGPVSNGTDPSNDFLPVHSQSSLITSSVTDSRDVHNAVRSLMLRALEATKKPLSAIDVAYRQNPVTRIQSAVSPNTSKSKLNHTLTWSNRRRLTMEPPSPRIYPGGTVESLSTRMGHSGSKSVKEASFSYAPVESLSRKQAPHFAPVHIEGLIRRPVMPNRTLVSEQDSIAPMSKSSSYKL